MISFSRFLPLLSLVLLASPVSTKAQNTPNMTVVERWLAGNSGVSSLKIDFTQTRTMRSLKVPVRQQGTLWLDYGKDRFRWQTGDPAQTGQAAKRSGYFLERSTHSGHAEAGMAPARINPANIAQLNTTIRQLYAVVADGSRANAPKPTR